MSERPIDVMTCGRSLLRPGLCCEPTCEARAVSAVIDWDLCEHTRCAEHDHTESVVARKPLRWDPLWAPEQGAADAALLVWAACLVGMVLVLAWGWWG